MTRLLIGVALLLAGCGARPTAAPSPAAPQMDPIIERYRQAIVLAESELAGQAQDQVPVVGRLLFEHNLVAVEALEEALVAAVVDAPTPFTPPPRVLAFLDRLERDPGLRDADKLAFRDVVDGLYEALTARAPESAVADLRARVALDRVALRRVHDLYASEIGAVQARLGVTRGMVLRREAWAAYVAWLRTRYDAAAILAAHAEETAPVEAGTRGGGTLRGTKLPKKTLVLTFDDGPRHRHTSKILDILKARGIKAVFFQVGDRVGKKTAKGIKPKRRGAKLTRRIVEEGHLLGNHTWQHKNLARLSAEKVAEQVDQGRALIESASKTKVRLFRPPYGARNATVMATLGARDMAAYLWNIDSKDWADPVASSVARRVLDSVAEHQRGVILFHDVHAQTVEALPQVLDALEAEGYQFALWDGAEVVPAAPAKAPKAQPAAKPAPRALYGQSWAVVIGVDGYTHWPKLAHAEQDARAVAESLQRLGFPADHVTTLLGAEATRDRILQVLGDELPAKVGPDDRVFVFFAGHGATRTLRSGSQRGYIVPVDADRRSLQARAISMSTLDDVNEGLAAKHVLFVMDACYGGLALTRGAPRRYLTEVTRRPARQILTAGGADEEVADHGPSGHSIFTHTLLRGLRGEADANADGHVTASELAGFVGPRVSASSRQTPAFGNLTGSEGGDFVFRLPGTVPATAPTPDRAQALAAELARARALLAQKEAELARLSDTLKHIEPAKAEPEGPAAAPRPTGAERRRARMLAKEGLTLYRAGDLPGGLAKLREAIDVDPNNSHAMNDVGFLLFKLGQLEDSRIALERTVELDPDRAIAWINLGDTLAALGEPDAAAMAFRRYLELKPDGRAAERIRAFLQARGGAVE